MCSDHKVKSLHIMLPKTNAYVKSYDEQTIWMYFLIGDDDLLGISADIKKDFDSEPFYNKPK